VQLEFEGDTGDGLALQEAADVFGRVDSRVLVLPLGKGAFHQTQQVLLLTIELGGGESEAGQALCLG